MIDYVLPFVFWVAVVVVVYKAIKDLTKKSSK